MERKQQTYQGYAECAGSVCKAHHLQLQQAALRSLYRPVSMVSTFGTLGWNIITAETTRTELLCLHQFMSCVLSQYKLITLYLFVVQIKTLM